VLQSLLTLQQAQLRFQWVQQHNALQVQLLVSFDTTLRLVIRKFTTAHLGVLLQVLHIWLITLWWQGAAEAVDTVVAAAELEACLQILLGSRRELHTQLPSAQEEQLQQAVAILLH